MKVQVIKRIWRQWVAAMLVVVMATTAPFQSAADQVNRFQAENEVEGDKSGPVEDRAMGDYRQTGAPSHTEPEDDTDPEHSTPSNAELGEDVEVGPATPSNVELLKTNKTYVVKFYVGSQLWDTQVVEHGGCAKEPTPPKTDGYTFVGWNSDYTNVLGNRSIGARFKTGTYQTHKVTFTDDDGRWLTNPQYVIHGQDAKRPASPKRDGYTFVGWDKQRFCIKQDTVITAQYREGELEVYFLRYGGRCLDKTEPNIYIKEEWIVKGEDGSPPDPEKVPGYTFRAWPDPNKYLNVQENNTIFASYYKGDVETYKIEFVDYDGRRLSYPQYIAAGKDPAFPTPPKREGYTWTGWDKTLPPTTSSIELQAVYIPGTYETRKITFLGRNVKEQSWDILKVEWVPIGRDATPPVPPVNAGYVFTKWDGKYTNVQSLDHVLAYYRPEESVTRENKLKTFKFVISELDLSEELEEAVIELGTFLAECEDGEQDTRAIGVTAAVTSLVAAIIAVAGGYAAKSVLEEIADSLTTCYGIIADVAVEAMWKVLDEEVEGDGEAEDDTESIEDAIKQLKEDQKNHILQDKHNWNKLTPDPKDPNNWNVIAALMSKVLSEGSERFYKYTSGGESVYIKALEIKGEIVEVTYMIIDGIYKIGDAWVK